MEDIKSLDELSEEEFVELVKEFISEVGIEQIFKNANLTPDEEDVLNEKENTE